MKNEKLSAKFDELNSLIAKIEAELVELSCVEMCGSVFKVFGPSPIQLDYQDQAQLGIIRISGKWRLCASVNDDIWRPLAECRASVRIHAIKNPLHLQELKDRLEFANERMIEEIDEAIRSYSNTEEKNKIVLKGGTKVEGVDLEPVTIDEDGTIRAV